MIHTEAIGRASEIRQEFQRAKPFRHVVIDNLLEAVSCDALLCDFPVFDEQRRTLCAGTHNNLSDQGLDVHIDFISDGRNMLHRRINPPIYLNKEWEESRRWGHRVAFESAPSNGGRGRQLPSDIQPRGHL